MSDEATALVTMCPRCVASWSAVDYGRWLHDMRRHAQRAMPDVRIGKVDVDPASELCSEHAGPVGVGEA